jgi:hypothetical protein
VRHKTLPLSTNDARAGLVPIHCTVITGSIEIDKNNVDVFLQTAGSGKSVAISRDFC